MKKQIRLLIEGLFDDLYDIEDQKNLDTEFTDKVLIKSKKQLRKEIEEQLRIQGPDADLNDIDVSTVTDMSYLFCGNFENESKKFSRGLAIKNIKIDQWDVSKVKNMSYMFFYCYDFLGNGLENWDVSDVRDMSYMFNGCNAFRGESIENWDVSKVTNMKYMFCDCGFKFNPNLSNWDVSNVIDMSELFACSYHYTGKGLNKWNINPNCNLKNMFTSTHVRRRPKWYIE